MKQQPRSDRPARRGAAPSEFIRARNCDAAAQLPYNISPVSKMPKARTILKRASIAAVAAVVLVYFGDTLSVWHRMANKTADNPLTTLTTQPIIEIPHKDGRDEIVLGQSQTQTCVRALFPHDGYSPCWYVARQNQSTTMMTLLPFLPAAAWITAHARLPSALGGVPGHRAR
jgi:hypothetical protein